MPDRPAPRRPATAGRPRPPDPPRLPGALESATLPDHDLEDEASFHRLAFELELAGRTAESVDFEQCRFQATDLSGTSLERARLTDCLIDKANLANLRAGDSSMRRVRLTGSRMTGLYWIGGSLGDVVISQCRADLANFRSSQFRQVVFEDCHLTGADFQNADLSGTQFVDCDLSGAQFSHATMAGTTFRGCGLAGIGGITSFAGATIASVDLAALTYTFAAALDITIQDSEPADDQ